MEREKQMMQTTLIIILLLIACSFMCGFVHPPHEKWNYTSFFEYTKQKHRCQQPSKYHANHKVAIVCYDNRLEKPNNKSYSDIMKLKERNEAYARMHNYDFIFFSKYPGDQDCMPPYWLKVQIVADVLKSGKYDYVMWIDSDAYVVDTHVRIERLFEVFGRKNDFFAFGMDFAPFFADFNAGVWIVKHTPLACQFLEKWLSKYPPTRWYKKAGQWKCKGVWGGQYFEQGSGSTLLRDEAYAPYILVFASEVMQSPGFHKGFTHHFHWEWKRRIKNL